MSAPDTQLAVKMITLRTADGQLFDVDETVAMEFATVKSFFDENSDATVDTVVPLPNVAADQLVTIIGYCKKHIDYKARGLAEEAKKYDADFVNEQSDESLKELILAANYLNIKDLLDVLNQNVADRIKNKGVEYVCKFLGIENDFTVDFTVDTVDTVFHLLNVPADGVVKINGYCKKHIHYKARGLSLAEEYDAYFVNEQSDESLQELIWAAHHLDIAAHHLDIEDFRDTLLQNAVDRARNNSFTPEEEEMIRNWVVY